MRSLIVASDLPVQGEPNPLAPGRGLLARLGRLLAWLHLALLIRRERRQLADMPPHLLRDIGVADVDARREAVLPWHAIPSNRLQR